MSENERICIREYVSPIGRMLLGSYGGRLCLCDWINDGREFVIRRVINLLKAETSFGSSPVIEGAIDWLDKYFAGRKPELRIPIIFCGTPFQKKVWNQLLQIPYGKTESYSQLAFKIGNPKAVRSVASANKANALSIIVPCHRVIGADCSLKGYAGGIDVKRFLLELEK